jgi:hypothetical protein
MGQTVEQSPLVLPRARAGTVIAACRGACVLEIEPYALNFQPATVSGPYCTLRRPSMRAVEEFYVVPRRLPRALLLGGILSMSFALSRSAQAQFTLGWGDTVPTLGPMADLGIPSTVNNSALAIPANRGNCGANGAVIVARGDSFNGALVSYNTLTCAQSGTGCVTNTRDIGAVHVPPAGMDDRFTETGRNDIARLGDGTIVVARMLTRYSPALPYNRRGMVAFFASGDCGNVWHEISQLDAWSFISPYEFVGGALYADPWRPARLFFVALDSLGTTRIFISIDGGYTWTQSHAVTAESGCKGTTMPGGQAYFVCLHQNAATIERYDPDSGWSPNVMSVGNDVKGIALDNHAIARIGTFPAGDYLRVTYPYRVGPGPYAGQDKIGVHYLTVKVAGDIATVTKTQNLIGSGTGSIQSATLVETDRFEMPESSMENSTLLYWQEEATTCSGNLRMKMRGLLARDYDNLTTPVVIDPYTNSSPCTGGNNIQGDSLRGGFFYDQRLRHLNFMAQWADGQPNNGVPGVSARVLSFHSNNEPVEAFGAFQWLGKPATGTFIGTPAVSSWGPEHIDVLAIANDNSLQHKSYDAGVWSPDWEIVIPGTIALNGPAAVSSQQGQIDVIVHGNDQGVWYATWNGAWQGWTPLGRPPDGTLGVMGEPAIASWAPGRLDLFANTPTGTWHRSCTSSCLSGSSWSSWENLGLPTGGLDGGVAAVAATAGRIDIFDITHTNKVVQHKSYDISSGWTAWDSFGGAFGGTSAYVTPAVASWAPGHWDLFARASNGFVHHKSVEPDRYSSSHWLSSSGFDLSGGFSQVAVTSPGPNRIHQVVVGADGAVWHAKTPYTRLVPVGVSQSTTVVGGVPERAVDGNIDGNWVHNSVTHTDFEFQPWWTADFGGSVDVSFVDVYNRTDCCADRLTNFNVSISQDGTNWTSFNTPGQGGSPTSVWINAPARYVKVQLVGTNNLSLAEVSVWAQ